MDGPWYECQGPTAEQVRKDVTKYISTNSLNQTSLTNDILLKIIPDSRNDFGSWRGYGTFGVVKEFPLFVFTTHIPLPSFNSSTLSLK